MKEGTAEIGEILQKNYSELLAKVDQIENENKDTPPNSPRLRSKSIMFAVSKVLKNRLLPYLRQAFTDVRHQYGAINNHPVNLESNGTETERSRDQAWKQRLENFAAWYNQLKAQSKTVEPSVVEYKQAEWENKIGETGATVAQREQQIKQQFKQWLQAATVKR